MQFFQINFESTCLAVLGVALAMVLPAAIAAMRNPEILVK